MPINSRIFGSDIPISIKKTLEARQNLADKDRQPNESINSEFSDDTFDPRGTGVVNYESTYEDLINLNFDGIADLSSRTPFVRMWLAADVYEKGVKPEEGDKPLSDSVEDINERYWYEVGMPGIQEGWYKEEQIISNVLYDGGPIIYQIGDNTLSHFELNPNDEVFRAQPSTDPQQQAAADLVNAALPLEYQINNNEFLRPPAGIISLTSETQGTLGVVKKTKVIFKVGNFHDYDKIYSRYFLKPGAQIFVDWGWDTADLYSPDELISGICPDYDEGLDNKHENELEKCLYGTKYTFIDKDNPGPPPALKSVGFDGWVTKSNGTMDTVIGIVTNYNARINEDGTVTCEVELTSKNTALMGMHLSDYASDNDVGAQRLKYSLETTVLYNALFIKAGGMKLPQQRTNQETEDLQLLRTIGYAGNTTKMRSADQIRRMYLYKLGFNSVLTEQSSDNTLSKEEQDTLSNNKSVKRYEFYTKSALRKIFMPDSAVESGVFISGDQNDLPDINSIYISIGHLEDLILNSEFSLGEVKNDGDPEEIIKQK